LFAHNHAAQPHLFLQKRQLTAIQSIMTVFFNKNSFTSLGLEPIVPLPSHISQGCTICLQPLAVYYDHASPQKVEKGHHSAFRIASCGHIHGKTCLSAWLDVGNSCPTCKRVLFEPNNEPLTQRDIDSVMRHLAPVYGPGRMMAALTAHVDKQEAENAARHRLHEQDVARQRNNARANDFTLDGDDFLDSDQEDGEFDWEDGEYEDDADDED
jgi:hypothetical protein